MIINEHNIIEAITKSITDCVDKKVGELFDEKIKELNERKNEIVAGIVLNVAKNMSFERYGENITFTIREVK